MNLKGASLIETVIAITIITVCSLIATLMYSTIIDATPPIKHYNYKHTLEKLISETRDRQDIVPYTKDLQDHTIEKSVSANAANTLYTITFLIRTEKRQLQKKVLIFKAPDEN